MQRVLIMAISAATLTACGGSGSSGPSVVPFSAEGFASANAAIDVNSTFTLPDTIRLVSDGSDTIVRDQQDVEIAIGEDGTTITVVLEGEAFELVWNGENGFVFEDDDSFVFFSREYVVTEEAEIVELFAILNDDNLNASYVTFGFDTDPSEVEAARGTATMEGAIFVAARQGFFDAFGSGPASLDVDFDSNKISGEFTIFNGDNSEFELPTTTFAFEETGIVGNGFTGELTLIDGDIEGTLSDTLYTGRFFGQNAPTAGGQVAANVTNEDGDVTLIEGAFLATQ